MTTLSVKSYTRIICHSQCSAQTASRKPPLSAPRADVCMEGQMPAVAAPFRAHPAAPLRDEIDGVHLDRFEVFLSCLKLATSYSSINTFETPSSRVSIHTGPSFFQTPPDLVVKCQPIDIVDVILRWVLRPPIVYQREIKG